MSAERDGRRDPRPECSAQRTALARTRLRVGLTQAQLSELTGIPVATIKRLERREITHPSIRMLANCAHVFSAFSRSPVPLEDLVEDEWRDWFVFDAAGAPAPPSRCWKIERRTDSSHTDAWTRR